MSDDTQSLLRATQLHARPAPRPRPGHSARGVADLAIAGVMTNLCVETTARDAFVLDYRVRVLLDACATVSAEMQRASLVNLAYGLAHVQTVEEYLYQMISPEEPSPGRRERS